MNDDYVLCAYKGGKDNGANISERIIIDDLSSPLLSSLAPHSPLSTPSPNFTHHRQQMTTNLPLRPFIPPYRPPPLNNQNSHCCCCQSPPVTQQQWPKQQGSDELLLDWGFGADYFIPSISNERLQCWLLLCKTVNKVPANQQRWDWNDREKGDKHTLSTAPPPRPSIIHFSPIFPSPKRLDNQLYKPHFLWTSNPFFGGFMHAMMLHNVLAEPRQKMFIQNNIIMFSQCFNSNFCALLISFHIKPEKIISHMSGACRSHIKSKCPHVRTVTSTRRLFIAQESS